MTTSYCTRNKRHIHPGWLMTAIIALSLCLNACTQQPPQSPASKATSGSSAQGGGANTTTTSTALISRKVSAFASSSYAPASYANDGSYDTLWRSQGAPSWLAYDLSGVPAAQRGKVLVVWYNESYDYDHTLIKNNAYNLPEDYTLEVNPAPGGGNPPENGWKTVITVKGNHYHSRQHLIDMSGNNWLRISITAIDGTAQNEDASLNMDIYNAAAGLADDWIFYGDSITAGAMGHLTMGGIPSFAQLINAKAAPHFPVEESGGISYLTSVDGANHINGWLPLFPGKYVALSYGTNDANGCVNPQTFYANYTNMIQAVLAASKVPVIPHFPWGRTDNIQQCGPALNAQIDRLYKAFPQIIKGPDLWTFFQQHQAFISNDNIHPTDEGAGQYRQQWANAMLKEVYKVGE